MKRMTILSMIKFDCAAHVRSSRHNTPALQFNLAMVRWQQVNVMKYRHRVLAQSSNVTFLQS
jgi:hypothetical protein